MKLNSICPNAHVGCADVKKRIKFSCISLSSDSCLQFWVRERYPHQLLHFYNPVLFSQNSSFVDVRLATIYAFVLIDFCTFVPGGWCRESCSNGQQSLSTRSVAVAPTHNVQLNVEPLHLDFKEILAMKAFLL